MLVNISSELSSFCIVFLRRHSLVVRSLLAALLIGLPPDVRLSSRGQAFHAWPAPIESSTVRLYLSEIRA